MHQNICHYTYEADLHCVDHADDRFGDKLQDGTAEDSEGNPVGAHFTWDECEDRDYCSECLHESILAFR